MLALGSHSGFRNHLALFEAPIYSPPCCSCSSSRRASSKTYLYKELKAPWNALWNPLDLRFRLRDLTECSGVFDSTVRADRTRLPVYARTLRRGSMWNCSLIRNLTSTMLTSEPVDQIFIAGLSKHTTGFAEDSVGSRIWVCSFQLSSYTWPPRRA